MGLHKEVQIKRQQAKVNALINQAIANCRLAIVSEDEAIYFPSMKDVHSEMTTLLRLLNDLEKTTDLLVNGR